MKKWLSLILVCLLVCSVLFGCSKASSDGAIMEDNGAYAGGSEEGSDILTDKTESSSTTVNPGQKLVRKIWLNAETEDMDPLLDSVNQRVTDLGGYMESRDVYNGSRYNGSRYRNAELTIRIPADQLDAFVQHVSENANITSNKETADDITLSYVATESRLKALQTEETRLLELLAEAKDMSDLLQIEDRLTQVRTELEQVKSQLNVYDNQVNYGTVYLSVSEVKEYTVTEEPTTVWGRITTGFKQSVKNLGKLFTELFVIFVVCLPYLGTMAVFVVVAVLLLKWIVKISSKKGKK